VINLNSAGLTEQPHAGPISVAVNVFVTSIKGRRLLDEELQRVRELGYLAQVEDEMAFGRNLEDASTRDDFIAWLMVRLLIFSHAFRHSQC
jgi:hypothetical protein